MTDATATAPFVNQVSYRDIGSPGKCVSGVSVTLSEHVVGQAKVVFDQLGEDGFRFRLERKVALDEIIQFIDCCAALFDDIEGAA